MPNQKDSWTLEELHAETGVEPRSIRRYIERGLLPGASSRGRGARYGRIHLDRLKCVEAIRKAAPQLGLDDIRQVLLSLDDERIHAIGEGMESVVAMPIGQPLPAAGPTDSVQAQMKDGLDVPESVSTLDYITQVRGRAGVAIQQNSPRGSNQSRSAGSTSALDRLVKALERGTGLDRPQRKARAEIWLSIPVTPDIEIRARGLDDHDRQRLELAADYLREAMMRDVKPSDPDD